MKVMKKVLSIFLLSTILSSCEEVNTPKKNTRFVVKEGYHPLTLVEVDSCEYLFGEWGNATVLTHKGNCKFCLERNK
jgi:hypothetical protein